MSAAQATELGGVAIYHFGITRIPRWDIALAQDSDEFPACLRGVRFAIEPVICSA